MNGQLAIIQNDDRLWLQHLRRTHDYSDIIDLNDTSFNNRPHHNNIYQWRRWLLRQSIQEVHFWQPAKKCLAIIAAARLSNIPVTVHLTGRLPYTSPMAFKLLDKFTSEFNCAGNFIAEQLYKNGISRNKTTVTIPKVTIDTISDQQRIETTRQINNNQGPVILALASPNEPLALKLAVWAGAILVYATTNLKLIVTGNCTRSTRQKLLYWQNMWDVPGMIYFADENKTWDQLVAACDIVLIASSTLGNGTMRLLHTCQTQKPIVAATGQANEYLNNYKQAHILNDHKPRHFAAAVLPVLDAIP